MCLPGLVRIRRATIEDMTGILRTEDLCFGEQKFNPKVIRSLLLRDDSFVLVAVEKDIIVGAAMGMFSRFQDKGRIASVAVLAEHRGRGIGRKLLIASEAELHKIGVTRFALEVSVHNSAAVDMYKSNGYSVKNTIVDYYGRGKSAFYMEKDVTMKGKRTKVKVS